ncbi:MAG: hypothetical protein WA947_20150 [Phormidesmis sp.]
MTPREELIQAIQTSPDEVILTLLEMIRKLAYQKKDIKDPVKKEALSERLYRKNGILVAETGRLDGFDLNDFIKEMREERIQKFVDQAGL